MFRSLASANYRTWFIGAFVSNIGFWMQRTAQDWIVLTELTDHDAAALGITMALQMGPIVLLVPVSGYLADRFERRSLLLATNSAMGCLAVILGVLTVSGSLHLWHIYVVAAAGGVIAAVENPAKQGFVSELVTSDRLSNAVSLNSASFNLARTAGPSIAAALVFVVGAGWVFFINAATFIVMIITIRLLHTPDLVASPKLSAWRGSLWSGFRYVSSRPDLRAVFLAVFLFGAFGMNFPIFSSTMTTVVFGLGVGQYGILLTFLAVGAVVGALLAARRERPRIAVIAVGAAAFSLALGAAAVMPTFWGFAIALVFTGVGVQTVMATANAVVQLTTEPVMRGRVLAIYMAVFMGGTPIGAPTIGWLTNAFGPRVALLAGAALSLTGAFVLAVYLLRAKGVGFRFWRAFTRADAVEELELDQVTARRI